MSVLILLIIMYLCLNEYDTILIENVENENNRKLEDTFALFTSFWVFLENYVMM